MAKKRVKKTKITENKPDFSALFGKKIVMLLANDFTHDSRVLKEALSAKNAGMEVTILARKSKNTPFSEEKDGLKIIRVQTWADKLWSKFSKSGGQEVAGSQSAGMPNGLATYAGILNTTLLNRLFVKEALKIRPDIVHANDSTTLPAAYRLKKYGFKIVYDAHELYSEQLENPNPIWQKFFVNIEKGLKKVDGIFSVNQSILDELATRYGVSNIPQEILYNAPYLVRTRPVKNNQINLLYLGHYMKGRGIEQMIEAAKTIDAKLTIYGKGFDLTDANITVKSPVSPDKIIQTAKKYDIGILPYIGNSLNNLYSTPNKLFEYMMSGLAIAASNLPEIAKIIKKTNTGVLFNPEDANDIAQSLKLLVENKAILNRCKKNSVKFREEYCWEKQAQKQLKLYNEII